MQNKGDQDFIDPNKHKKHQLKLEVIIIQYEVESLKLYTTSG